MFRWYVEVLAKYITFDGRASRAEYWWFVLANIIIDVILNLVSAFLIIQTTIIQWGYIPRIYLLAMLIPFCAVGVRRMHDIGRSGWWLLIPIYSVYLLAQDSQPRANEYGANPKQHMN